MHSTAIHLPDCQLSLIETEGLHPQLDESMRTWNIRFLSLCLLSFLSDVCSEQRSWRAICHVNLHWVHGTRSIRGLLQEW